MAQRSREMATKANSAEAMCVRGDVEVSRPDETYLDFLQHCGAHVTFRGLGAWTVHEGCAGPLCLESLAVFVGLDPLKH